MYFHQYSCREWKDDLQIVLPFIVKVKTQKDRNKILNFTFQNRLIFHSMWKLPHELYMKTWLFKFRIYLLSICPVASWDTTGTLLTKERRQFH